jgi:hypothetical protein
VNIVLNPSSTRKSSKNKLQARFDKLRQQMLKQQTLNRTFQEELDELVTIYQTQLLQLDSDLIEPLTQLASKLIDFYSRKSLAQWHREELGDWIIEILERIGRVQPETAKELHGKVREIIAGQMGMTVEEMEEEARRCARDFEEALEFAKNTKTSTEEAFTANGPQDDMFGFDEIFGEEATDEHYFDQEDPFDGEPGDTEARRQRLMDGSWVRSLFRRAAQALHPDREQNPEQRHAKQRAMQQLLAARKQGDIMTLLQLYSECVDGNELVLAEQEMTSACELMEEQLDELRLEKAAFIYQHPLRTQVHDMFYSSSRKIRDKRIDAWKQDLRAGAEHTLVLVEELRNLKILKIVLEERREGRLFDDLDWILDGLR